MHGSPKTKTDKMPVKEKLNIHQRMHGVMSEIAAVTKDEKVSVGGSRSYKGMSHDGVVRAVRSILLAHGVVVYPSVISQEVDYYDVEKTYQGDTKVTQWTSIMVTMETRFQNIEDSDDYVVVKSIGQGVDNGDKAPGKASSYAKKYGILQALLLETQDGDEQRSADFEEGRRSRANTQKPGVARPVASQKQIKFVTQMLSSHHFSEDEGKQMLDLVKRSTDKGELKRLIDRTQDILKKRTDAENKTILDDMLGEEALGAGS